MDVSALIKVGLNRNEAIVYQSLAELGSSPASAIVKKTKFHRKIVYENLEKLTNRGLVSHIIENGVRRFRISSPQALLRMVEDDEMIVQERKSIAKGISAELRVAHREDNTRHAEIRSGTRSVRTFFEEALERGPYVSFGAPKESIRIMGEHFWDNHTVKRVARKQTVRLIFNQSLKAFGKSRENRFTKIRYSKERFEPLTETHIQKDGVTIIVWTEEPILFIIKDAHVAASYRAYFEDMWAGAK